MKRFLMQLFALAVVIGAAILFWNTGAPQQFRLDALWLILIVFIITTSAVHYLLLKSTDKKAGAFVNNFIGATFIKLMLYLVVIIIFCISNRTKAKIFISGFLIQYLFFTAFEVWAILQQLKKS